MVDIIPFNRCRRCLTVPVAPLAEAFVNDLGWVQVCPPCLSPTPPP